MLFIGILTCDVNFVLSSDGFSCDKSRKVIELKSSLLERAQTIVSDQHGKFLCTGVGTLHVSKSELTRRLRAEYSQYVKILCCEVMKIS